MKLTNEATVLGKTVTLTVEIPDGVRQDAAVRIQGVMMREVERFAQIAAVDLRDQAIEDMELSRISALGPGPRPHVMLAAGNEDPETGAQVLEGEYHLAGRLFQATRR